MLWAVLGGLAGVPIGAVVGLALAYGLLMLRGVKEHEGRRGLLAGVFGIAPGIIAGFWCGFSLVRWNMTKNVEWRSVTAGSALGALLAISLFIGGLIGGIHLAESRGVTNYAGERAAWSLFFVALPLAVLGGFAGFVAGWLLS